MTAVRRPRPVVAPISGRTSTIAVAAGAAALIATASGDDGLVLCPFRRCTGGYCPGCGATRAANRLVRGDVAASWSHHPWVVVLAVQAVIVGGWFLARRHDPRTTAPRAVAILGVLNAVGLLAVWAARLATGSIPAGWLPV